MDNFREDNRGDRDRDRDREQDRGDRARERYGRIRVDNALIESITVDNNRTGYVTISYNVPRERNTLYRQFVVLIVSRDTVIENQFGQRVPLRELTEGMRIDAEFSSAMTRSIPPQARAFEITVRRRRSSSNVKLGMIINVDVMNQFFVTGSINNLRNQIRFAVSNATIIYDRNGNRIQLRNLRPGMMVRVEHANYQTASIPPQTTALRVQVL